MKYEVLVTSQARRQIAETALWWSEHRSSEQALKWLDGVESAIADLSLNADDCDRARENQLYDLSYEVRQLNFGLGTHPTHRIVFEIRGAAVYVVAVRHLAQGDISPHEL